MKLRKFRTPITTLFNGIYVAPGTEIELPEDEASAIISRHGSVDVDVTLTLTDIASVESLNRHASLEKH